MAKNPSDRITTDPCILHGNLAIRGLRYSVETILELMSSGRSVDEILADYQDLEVEDISAVLEYAASVSQIKRIDLAA